MSDSPDTVRLMATPNCRQAVHGIVRQALTAVAPWEQEVADEMIDPLIDVAARGEVVQSGSGDHPGGFGGVDLMVWFVTPLVVWAVANLVRELGRDWSSVIKKKWSAGELDAGGFFALSVKGAKLVVALPEGIDVSELLRVVHQAILDYLDRRTRRPAIPYRDLAIALEPDGEDGYRSRVLPFSGGSTPAPFLPPLEPAAITEVLSRLEGLIRGRRRELGGPHFEGEHQPHRPFDAEDLGGKLFAALFTGSIRDAYRDARVTANARDEGVRLRLVLDPGHRELSALPWELLFDREEDGFLSLNHRTPIVRYLERETPADPRLDPATRPLRVLVACAVPEDAQALQIERETERIVEALRRRRDIRVEAIYKTTVQDLRDGLRDFSPHVLHVIAHGEIEGGKGALVLRTSAGYSERLGGEHLSTKLRGCHDLRLVVLNACDTAFLPREEGLDPFSSVAAVLVRRHKLPAVVAMQFPITDEAAVAFGGALYASLAAGDPVEAAISEGRQAIYDRDQDYGSFEWATPVLYLRVDSGQIFRFGSDTLPP